MKKSIKINYELNGQMKTIEATFDVKGSEAQMNEQLEANETIIREFISEAYGYPAKDVNVEELRGILIELVKADNCIFLRIGRLKTNKIDRERLSEFRRAIAAGERWTVFTLFRNARDIYNRLLTYDQQMKADLLCDMARESL